MYSIKLENDDEKKVGKGVKKSALMKKVTHDNYKKCLLGDVVDERQLIPSIIWSINHEIYGMKFTEVGLSIFVMMQKLDFKE